MSRADTTELIAIGNDDTTCHHTPLPHIIGQDNQLTPKSAILDMVYPGNTIRVSTLESERENLSMAEHTTCASPIDNLSPEVCLTSRPGIAETTAPEEQVAPRQNNRQLRPRREKMKANPLQLDPQKKSYEHLWH